MSAALPRPVLLMVRALELGGSERQMAELAQALDKSERNAQDRSGRLCQRNRARQQRVAQRADAATVELPLLGVSRRRGNDVSRVQIETETDDERFADENVAKYDGQIKAPYEERSVQAFNCGAGDRGCHGDMRLRPTERREC